MTKALTRDKVDGVPMCNDCEDERICQFGHLHATPEGATGCQRKQDTYARLAAAPVPCAAS